MAKFVTSLEPNDPFTTTAEAQLELGTVGVTAGGRAYRYVRCNASTATVAGSLYQSAATTTTWQALSIAAAAKGAKTITTTSTITATKDQLAGGFVVVSTTPGQGYTYKITGNTAASAAVCTITLEDPIQIALTTGTTIDLIMSPYDRVEIWDYSNHDGDVVGVSPIIIPAGYYGWLQFKGPCGTLVDSGNMTIGKPMYASAAVDGAVDETSTYGYVGIAMEAGSSGEFAMVDLNIN